MTRLDITCDTPWKGDVDRLMFTVNTFFTYPERIEILGYSHQCGTEKPDKRPRLDVKTG